jgi:hypothetical protein
MDTLELVYEPMPKEFDGRGSNRGWVFNLVKREGMVCVYRKVSEEGLIYYEVVVLRRENGGNRIMGGVEVYFKPKERYPSDEEFGRYGWCYVRECDALARYEALVGEKS